MGDRTVEGGRWQSMESQVCPKQEYQKMVVRWFHIRDDDQQSKTINIGLQFLASGLSISHEIHPKPYKSKCFNQNYSV